MNSASQPPLRWIYRSGGFVARPFGTLSSHIIYRQRSSGEHSSEHSKTEKESVCIEYQHLQKRSNISLRGQDAHVPRWMLAIRKGNYVNYDNFFQNPAAPLISFNTIWQFEEKSVTLQAETHNRRNEYGCKDDKGERYGSLEESSQTQARS